VAWGVTLLLCQVVDKIDQSVDLGNEISS